MIQVPHSYAQWAELLTMIKNNTDNQEVLQAMQQGTLQWQSGVAERFSQRLSDTINTRYNAAIDKMQKDFSRAHGQEMATVQALLTFRKEASFLIKVVDLPALPETERKQFIKIMRENIEETQKNLEDSAKKIDRTGKMSSLVRNNRVDNI